jgi:hypothetical protein
MWRQTTVFVEAVFSENAVSFLLPNEQEEDSHCHHVRRASLVSFLVLCTPGSNDITKMAALVLDLCIVTHYAQRRIDLQSFCW